MPALRQLQEVRDALAVRTPRTFSVPGFRDAAVVVPLLVTDAGLELLFTVRSRELRNHAGQIAFPGGAVDPGETLVEAALREMHEEVGLRVPAGNVLGYLDEYPTPARYVATPVVAWLQWPQEVRINPAEVAEVFTVPLSDLKAIVPYWKERQLEGMTRRLHYYEWGDRLIWGFTGNVVRDFLALFD